jgi:hypothetical protein
VAGWQAQYDGGLGNVDAFLTARAPDTAPFATGGTRQHVDSAEAHDEGDMHATTAVNSAGKAVVAWRQATFNGDFRIQAAKRIVAARAKATIKAGTRATPSLKLLKPAKALLTKKHSLSLTGTVKVTDAAGNTHSFPVKTRLTAKR